MNELKQQRAELIQQLRKSTSCEIDARIKNEIDLIEELMTQL